MYRSGQQHRQEGGGRQDEAPMISQAAPLPFPLEAKLDATGETVTLLQTCDWPDHSPSNIGVDQYGKQFIASFTELTVTDHRVVPNEQANRVRSRGGALAR